MVSAINSVEDAVGLIPQIEAEAATPPAVPATLRYDEVRKVITDSYYHKAQVHVLIEVMRHAMKMERPLK